jgi:hypothetical protein
MAVTKQASSQMLSLAAQVLQDRTASDQAKLLAATVLAEVPLPSVKRERASAAAD